MYKFTKNIKIFSLTLIILGALGLGYGFYSAPSSVEEAKAMVSNLHEDSHGDESLSHDIDKNEVLHKKQEDHSNSSVLDSHSSEDSSHDKHLLNQLQNRPWAALYVAALFFMMLSLGTLAFYAIQRASQAGWSPILFRVMEGITAYLFPGTLIILIILILSSMHLNHLFVWMDPEVVEHDEIIQAKSGYLNSPFLIARAIFYILGWNLYRYYSRKFSLAQDKSNDISNHVKNFKISAGFLAFFIVTESMMSWDWIMSLDPHWFSTLFGWYILATFMVSAVTVIAMVTVYLRSKGHLEYVNDSHIHDLAKFMFGFSIFWTYLWFSQFMLIWYADMPEETTYFVQRFEEYKLPFLMMIPMNFIFPILLLMNSDLKEYQTLL